MKRLPWTLSLALGAAVFMVTTSAINAESHIGLDEILERAREHSPAGGIPAARMAAAEADLSALSVWYLPDVYGELGYGVAANGLNDRHGPIARIVSEWTLWDGGRRRAREAILEQENRLSRAEANEARLKLNKTLAFVYFRAARLVELRQLISNQIASLRRLERLLYPRLRVGTATNSDVALVRVSIARLEEEDRDAAATIALLRQHLALASGLEGSPEAIILSPLTDVSIHVSRENPGAGLTLQDHPRYRAAQARAQALGLQLAALESELYGTTVALQLYGGYGPPRDAIDPYRAEAGAEIAFRFPILESSDRDSRLQAAQGRVRVAQLEAQQDLLELRIELEKWRSRRTRNTERLEALTRLIRDSERMLGLAYGEFARGQKAPADMHAALDSVYELQRDQLNARLEATLSDHELSLIQSFQTTEGDNNEEAE